MELEILFQVVPVPIVVVLCYLALSASAASLPISNDGKRISWGGWVAGLAIITASTILYTIAVWFFSIFAGTTGDPASVVSFRKYMFFETGAHFLLMASVSPFVLALILQKVPPNVPGIQEGKLRMAVLFLVIALPGFFILRSGIDLMAVVIDQLKQWKR